MTGFSGFLALIILVTFSFSRSYNDRSGGGHGGGGHGGGSRNTVRMVATVFRHGDRNPDLNPLNVLGFTYPKDPYINETYFPYGSGELNNAGKVRMYKLGQLFRSFYDRFLGPLYLPGIIDAVTTNMSRTECSLQVFLAGLFPPRYTILEWNTGLNWNPIPYNKVAVQTNRVLSIPVLSCQQFQVYYETFRLSPAGVAIEDRFRPQYAYIQDSTGLPMTKVLDLFAIYFILFMQENWGFSLPPWSAPVYPKYLFDAVMANNLLFFATPDMIRLNGGFLLKKTIDDMQRIIDGKLDQPKMYIYSAHEAQVTATLVALNLYDFNHIPYFSSAVIFELHQIGQNYFVKIRYNKDYTYHFDDLAIPGCQVMCPFLSFKSLLQNYIPPDGDPCIIS